MNLPFSPLGGTGTIKDGLHGMVGVKPHWGLRGDFSKRSHFCRTLRLARITKVKGVSGRWGKYTKTIEKNVGVRRLEVNKHEENREEQGGSLASLNPCGIRFPPTLLLVPAL